MLEKQLSVLLATYLNRFICDLNEEQLRISLWSGDLVLRDLELRTNILDQIALSLFQGKWERGSGKGEEGVDAAEAAAQALLLPFTVVKGVVNELVITVPWSALDREPISVEVRGVEVVFGLLRGRPYNAEEDASRVLVVKQKQLQMFEMERLGRRRGISQRTAGSPLETGKEGGAKPNRTYVEMLTETITRNIHIVLRDVSIKYVLDYHGLAPCFTCALSVAIDEAYITTTDEEWEDRFIMNLSMPYCKKVVFGGLRVSVHAIKQKKQNMQQREQPEGEEDSNASRAWKEEMTIVEMIDLTLLMRLAAGAQELATTGNNRVLVSATTTHPMKIRASFGALGTMAMINSSLRDGLLGVNYRQHLHLLNESEGEADRSTAMASVMWAQRRWKYALCCVLDDVRRSKNKGRGHHCFVDSVVHFGKRRREYCALWKRAKGVSWLPPLTTEENTNLSALEKVLTLEQVLFLRCLAYAELSKEKQCLTQQKLYIADAIRRKQPTNAKQSDAADNNNNSSGSNNSRTNSWWWWWWAGRRSAKISDAPDLTLDEQATVMGSFESEWAFGYDFLQRIATTHVGPSMKPASLPSTSSSGTPFAIEVKIRRVDMEFYPHTWRGDVSEKKPTLAYLENIKQHLQASFNEVEYGHFVNAMPRDGLVGITFGVGSCSIGFAGSLLSPLVESSVRRKKLATESSNENRSFTRERWLSINVNETCSVVSGSLEATSITVQPLCELQWWLGGIRSFLEILPLFTQKATPLCELSAPPRSSSVPPPVPVPVPVVDFNIAEVILTMPLTTGKTERSDLSLYVPEIFLSTVGSDETHNAHEPVSMVKWRFSAGGEKPVRLCCEGIADVVTLSYVEVDMSLGKRLSVFVRTRLEVSVDPVIFGLMNDHLESLILVQQDTGRSLVSIIDANDGEWHLESNGALIVGSTVVAFPEVKCRSYLILLYQIACAREMGYKKAHEPRVSTTVATATPFLERFAVSVDFAHATVRDANHEDVVNIELPGHVTMENGELTSLLPLPSQGALTLEVTCAGASGYDFLLQLPDVHVTSPSGQHVLVLEALTLLSRASLGVLSVDARALQVLLCHSLVDCVEVLLTSCASLQLHPHSSLVSSIKWNKAGDDRAVSDTNAAGAATYATKRVMNVSLKRMDVRLLIEKLDESVSACVSDLILCVDHTPTGQKMRLRGALNRIEYAAEDADGLRTCTLFGPSCGAVGNAQPLSFNCDVENKRESDGSIRRSVLFETQGGRVDVFFAYWMQVVSLHHDPNFVRLLALLTSGDDNFGYSEAHTESSARRQLLLQQKENRATETSHLSTVTSIKGEVNGLEFLLATDASREIDVHSASTFTYFNVEKIMLTFESLGGEGSGGGYNSEGGTPRFTTEVKLFNSYHLFPTETECLLHPFIAQASMTVENYVRLVPNADRSGYEYATGNGSDLVAHMRIGTLHSRDNDTYNTNEAGKEERETPAEAAMDMKLTTAMLNSLLRALYANILKKPDRAGCSRSDAGSTGVTTAPAVTAADRSTCSVLITVSSARVVLIHEQDVFSVRAQLQFYSCGGTRGESATQMIHLNAVTVDDISPSRLLVRRDIPEWRQRDASRELLPNRKKRILEVESGCTFMMSTLSEGSLTTTTEYVLDGVKVYPARSSLVALMNMLLCDDIEKALRASKSSSHSRPYVSRASPSSVMVVTVRQCSVHLEEPWEESLATLSLGSVSMRLYQCGGERTVELLIHERVTLEPCYVCAAQGSILEWGELPTDLATKTSETGVPAYLRITATLPIEAMESYQFGTQYKEKPQVRYTRRFEVVLQSARLIANVEFLRRLMHFALSEVAAYTALLPAAAPANIVPVTSVPAISASVRDLQVFFPMEESLRETGFWRLVVQTMEIGNECTEVVLDNTAPAGMGCLYCFSNTFTISVWGALLSREPLYPLLLPNTVVRMQLPVSQSTYSEWRSSVSVTSDDRAYIRSNYIFVAPASLSAPISPLFSRRIHIRPVEEVRFSISAHHIHDAMLALTVLSSSHVEETPLYYATPPQVGEASPYTRSLFALELPRLSVRVTETGHAASAAALEEEEKNGGIAAMAELRLLSVVTLTIQFAPCDETRMRVHFAVRGAFELLDGQGAVVLYRCAAAADGKQPPRPLLPPDDTGLLLEISDTVQERRMRVESRGVIISLHPHSVDFVLRMHNFIALVKHEGFLGGVDSGVGGATGDKSMLSTIELEDRAASHQTSPQQRKKTTLTFRIATASVMIENTALLEARNMEARFSWDTVERDADSIPYNFLIGELSLRRMESQEVFVSVSALELSLGVGQVNIRAKSFIINNYDMLFYSDLRESVGTLHDYITQNVKFSKKNEDGFKQSVIVTPMDFRVCFFLSRHSASSGLKVGSVDLVFPAVILKQTAHTAGRSLTFETESGVIRYCRPQGLLSPLVKNISCTCFMEENLVAQSRSVVVHLSSLEAFIPLGDTLQCCVEAVAQAVLPLLCFPLAAYRHDNNDYNTAAVVAAPPTPLCSDKLVFSVPLVSLNVCASQSDDLLVERPSVLFGVSVHKVFFERSRMGVNEKTLAQVLSITSTVDPAIQNEFVSATAPRGALDAPSQWALYFWYEVSSVEAETRSESSAEGVAVSEQMPSRLVDVIARAHAVKLTVSPQLLSTLNEHVLVHVASGMCRTRNTAVSWVPSRHVKDVSSTLSSSSGGDHHERLIIITHDFCLKADLTLGGRRGSCLRFAKEPIEKGPQNRITVKCINHARVIVSFLVAADGSQKLPIVVDPGITVVFEGVPFVLEHGKVMDYVKLGGRSVFVAPTESVVVVPVGGPLTPSPAAATPSMTLALNNARWYNLKVSLDVSADVVLQLWSKRQTIAVSCEAYARYKLEKNCFEANRGVRDFMDESGEVGLSNVSILCDSGRITKEPTGLVVHVKHHKLKEDRTNAGMTVVRASVPPTGFTLSMGNLRLLLDTYNQLRQGVEHIGSTMRGTTALESAHTKDGRDFSHSKPTPSSLSSSTVHQTPVENSLVWSHEGEVTPLIEFGASAPQMEFILTNDFYKTEATIMLNSFALLAKGNRSLNRMACTASMVVRVSDYPQLQPSREVIAVSSEVAVDYARYAGGGFSLQGALTCPHASVTVPLVTALRLLRCRLDLRRTGIYSFCNKTGIPLLISAVGGAKQRSQEEKNELYSLPLEKLVKANLFHYNQTRFRVIHGEEEEISKQYKNIGALGTEVDLSVMQRGETYRFPLIGGSTGVMDVAMRLDEMKRVVDITTSVEVKNELATYTVCFPASLLEPFVVRPKETRYATLPCLRQPLSLMIGGWRLNVKNSLMTLEAFISAFTLLPEGRGDTWSNSGSDDNVFPRCAYMDDDNTLVVPLTLTEDHYGEGDTKQTRKEANGFGILLVLTRRVALESQPRTSRLLPRYEVELSVCPLATVLNQTGAPLAVTITPLSSSAQVSAAAASTATDLSFVQDQEEFNCFSQCRDDETPMINLTCELANGVRLCSLEPVPLTFRGTTTVGMKAPGEEKIIALVVERTASWKFVVRVAVILVNALSFPVWVYDDSKELVIGQKSGVGLAPGDKLSVTHSSTRQRLPQPNAAVSVCIVAGSNTAKHSQKFACNAPTFSGMLQSVDGDIVRIFKAHRTGGMKKVFTPTPVVRLESMWVFRNKSHTLPLTVRCVGLEETAVIAPRMTMEWTTFAASSAMDPLVQVRYGTDEKELFAWSEVVKLVTLSSSNVPIVMKHLIREENMGVDVPQMPAAHLSLGVRIFTSLRVPKFVGGEGERERFTCLSIAPSRHKNGYFVVDFTLDENIPVVVENRTGRLLQYEQIQNSASRDERAVNVYILQPFVDGVTCFKGEHVTPIMRLTLFGGSERSQSCTIDLAKAATTREAVQTSKHMFVLCTYDYSLQRYYVSVTVDRSLENSLLFQPRYIIHLETFIQSLSLHIASICVPKSETSLQNTPFATLIKRNQLRLGCMATTESTNAELLAALKRSELDVILVQAVGIYSAISINERHYFGRLDVGRLALIDCTTPRPLHPIIVCLDGGEDTINKCQEEGGKPSFSINVHALVPEEEATTERSHVSPKIVTVPLQHLCVNVAPMTLNLADSLLFVLRQAGICVLEAVEQMDIAKTVHGGSEDTSENTSPESSVISEDILIYNCHIGHLMVSRIDLELTITRRSDGKFDPFAGFTMGGRLVPSVERAPLIIGEVERTDVNQCSNSLQGALVSMLWPSYRNQFLLQLYKIVGSLEVLGNPLALMSGWGKGVRSFVVETADMNPLKGARAFLLATTSSTLHSVGLLSRVGSRTAASISWDNDWLEARDENERLNDSSQPSGVLWGVAQGLRGGIEGVVSRPWNGARNAGIAGFCTGIAAGAVGLLTRPVASVLDGFGNTAEFYSKLLQEPDCIPKAHGEYLESERNFYAAAVVPLADPVSATDSKRNSTLTTPLGGAAGCSGGPELLLKGLGPSKTWNATNCEFVSVAMYQALDRGARRDGLQGEEAARFLMNTVGVHNYALHADWESFVAYTTPEEYYTWVHVAFASALKGELEKFAFNSPASVTLSSSLLLLHSRETAATTQEENVDAGVERARNIKNTLGPRDLLKYVSLEHFVQVCSLEEVKHHVAPETIHTKLPQLLLSGVKASLEFLLQGGGHH